VNRQAALFEEATSFRNLIYASKRARRGKLDRQAVAAFDFNLETEVIQLRAELISGDPRAQAAPDLCLGLP
jgi:hypothetical protein